MRSRAYSLSDLADHASSALGVRRSDVQKGDTLILHTQNSIYTAKYLGNGQFLVKGGWFSVQEDQYVQTSISGCTWGGKCIQQNLLASPGMRVEFGNRVLTSILKRVVKIPSVMMN